MSSTVYLCWCPYDKRIATEKIEAETSFEARKIYAARHHKQVTEIVGRRHTVPTERKTA